MGIERQGRKTVERTHNGSTSESFSTGRKLVALSVTEGRGTPSGFALTTRQALNSNRDRGGDLPEWSIQAARKLGRIAHERAFISVARVDKSPLHGQDPSVHHVARSNTIRAGFGVGKGDICETLDRREGVDCPVFIEDATVSVRGVLAKADVTGDIEGGVQFLEFFYGENYGTLLVIRGGPDWVLRKRED